MKTPLDDLPHFLAHALALEEESAERYRDLARNLAAHHNRAVAELFGKMARYGDLHAAEVRSHAATHELPRLAPWDFHWPDDEGPETQAFEGMDYQLTPRQALKLALVSERRGHAFYADVAERGSSKTLRRLAASFAAEEAEHVRLLEAWIALTPASPPGDREDPDPPNTID